MRIYPRIVEVSTGDEQCQFKIKNSSKDDRILLFKIRRSEPKLVDYSPKCGIVEPGVTKSITMKLVDTNVTFARVLVKLAALKRDQLTSNFNDNWELAANGGKDVVKKVVDIRNTAFRSGESGDFDEELSQSCASESIGDIASPTGMLSPAEEMINGISNGNGEHKHHHKHHHTSHHDHGSHHNAHKSTADNVADRLNNVHSPAHTEMTSASVMSPETAAMLEIGNTGPATDGDRDDIGKNQNQTPNAKGATVFRSIDSPSSIIKNASNGAIMGALTAEEKRLALKCSKTRMLSTRTSTVGTSDSNVVEVIGLAPGLKESALTEHLVAGALKMRCVEVYQSRQQVVALELTDLAHVKEFKNVVGGAFNENPADEVQRMRAVMLETSLRHIILTGSQLARLDKTINRFSKLASLDLSRNSISSIDGLLELPMLQRLDISHNNLTTLESLENLHSLKSINAGHNRLKNLSVINLLVPLAGSIVNLDLSRNPMSADPRYAAYVVSAFPKLAMFDSRDLGTMVTHKGKANFYSSKTAQHMQGTTVPGSHHGGSYAATYGSRSGTPLHKQGSSHGKNVNRSVNGEGTPMLPLEASRLGVSVDEGPIDGFSTAGAHNSSLRDGEDLETEYDEADRDFDRRLGQALRIDRNRANSMASNGSVDYGFETLESEEEQVQVLPTPTVSARKPNSNNSGQQNRRPQSAPYTHDRSDRVHGTPSLQQQSISSPVRASAQTADGSNPTGGGVPSSFSPHLTQQTSSSKGRRKSTAQGLVGHWSSHKAEEDKRDQQDRLNHLTKDIASNRSRRKSFGISGSAANTPLGATNMDGLDLASSSVGDSRDLSGYNSDPSGRRSIRSRATPTSGKFRQMQEEPRYGIYHPRYRVPKKNFGFSKPFAHRSGKALEEKSTHDVPLFDKYVQRMRDGFEKLPTRGTWSRASKGLQAEWYPMDNQDLEAVRRQGYFHETIGDIQLGSYKDKDQEGEGLEGEETNTSQANVTHGTGIYSGSVQISPRGNNRRASMVQHQSRQYTNFDRTSSNQQDEYTDYRKWYPAGDEHTHMSSVQPKDPDGPGGQLGHEEDHHNGHYRHPSLAPHMHGHGHPNPNTYPVNSNNVPTMALNISLDSYGSSQAPSVSAQQAHDGKPGQLNLSLNQSNISNNNSGNNGNHYSHNVSNAKVDSQSQDQDKEGKKLEAYLRWLEAQSAGGGEGTSTSAGAGVDSYAEPASTGTAGGGHAPNSPLKSIFGGVE